uniref:DUF1279 domain-containing protein n=1 Tax=Phytophthora ramorum TaxID=164328 RepID=H3GWV0_PHYRM
MRYLGAYRGMAQRDVTSSGRARLVVARALSSSIPSSGKSGHAPSCSWPPAVAASRHVLGFPVTRSANCGMLRLWSSGRTSKDPKETAPLTGGEPTSSPSVKVRFAAFGGSEKLLQQGEEDAEKELEQPGDEQLQPQSWRQRAQTFAVVYGRVGICTHIVLSLLSFSVIYVGVSSGVDVTSILDAVGLSTSVSDSTTNSAGSFLIAYTIYKVLAPVRWPLTFAVTPVVLRALRRRGYMLAATNSSGSPPPPPQ